MKAPVVRLVGDEYECIFGPQPQPFIRLLAPRDPDDIWTCDILKAAESVRFETVDYVAREYRWRFMSGLEVSRWLLIPDGEAPSLYEPLASWLMREPLE